MSALLKRHGWSYQVPTATRSSGRAWWPAG
ncbi:hypothetical protein ACIG54_37100 [Streptomyces achromogenes]